MATALLAVLQQSPLGREQLSGQAPARAQHTLVHAALNHQAGRHRLRRLLLTSTAQPGQELSLPFAPAA